MAGNTTAAPLFNGATFRSVRRGIRGDVESFSPATDPDPGLVDIVERPFESATDAIDRLSRLETELRSRNDRRAVFLTVYTRMTREVHDGIEFGTFADPDWMRRYVVAFANYYRRAFLEFERGNYEAVPDPWRIAFGTAVRGDALVAQNAALGVNAHINYDLALTLDDIGIDPNRERKHDDHQAVNGILVRLIDIQQRALADLYASLVDEVDDAFRRVDEAVSLLLMMEGRAQAWRMATVLADAGVPPVPFCVRGALRATATGAAFFIRNPYLDPDLLGKLRAAESERMDLDTMLERVHDRIDRNT